MEKRQIALSLSYLGSAYHGYQVQSNAATVSAAVQDAVQAVVGRREEIKGCSRTDAGVHALAFCVSFFTDSKIPLQKLPLALNAHLPEDIRVFSARQVSEEFHPRYSCTGKAYLYRVRNTLDRVFPLPGRSAGGSGLPSHWNRCSGRRHCCAADMISPASWRRTAALQNRGAAPCAPCALLQWSGMEGNFGSGSRRTVTFTIW